MNVKIGIPCESTVVYKTLPNMSMDAGLVWGIVVLAAVFFCGGWCCFHKFFPLGIWNPYQHHPAIFQGYHNPGYHNPGSHPNNAGYHPQFYPPQQNTDPYQNNLHNQREPEHKESFVQRIEHVHILPERHNAQDHRGFPYPASVVAQPSQSHIDPHTGRDHSIPLVVPHPSLLNPVHPPSVVYRPTGPPVVNYPQPFHPGFR